MFHFLKYSKHFCIGHRICETYTVRIITNENIMYLQLKKYLFKKHKL